MITLAFLIVSALPVTPLQTGDVQSAAVFELNVGLDVDHAAFCKTILEGDPWCPKAGRRYELNVKERERILTLLNGAGAFTSKAKCTKPRHAVLFQTTKGPRAFDISFECNSINGRTMSKATSRELATFLRTFGLVGHLPIFHD
jgi:hypothetical protein